MQNTPTGLNNTGNTCYLNGATQMLLQNLDFCNLVFRNRNVNDNMKKLEKFIETYHQTTSDAITPTIVKKIVSDVYERFRGNSQEDGQDLLNSFMDILNDYTKNTFSSLFKITSTQTLKCKLRSCLNKSKTTDVNDFLILPIESNTDTLDKCYQKYKIHEKLEGDNMYDCPHCNAKRNGSRRIEITDWPKHLIVFLKRFSNDGAKTVKNSQEINIPIQWRKGYKLRGCIIHTGNIKGGHYFYISRIVKKDGSIHWYNCDDSNVSEISQSSAELHMNKNGYIIYYEKDV